MRLATCSVPGDLREYRGHACAQGPERAGLRLGVGYGVKTLFVGVAGSL